MLKVPRAPSFQAQLQQKLFVIMQAYRTQTEAAKVIGVCRRALYRWLNGKEYPSAEFRPKVDEAYHMAAELLENPEEFKRRKKAATKLRGLATKLQLSEDTVRLLQAQGLY